MEKGYIYYTACRNGASPGVINSLVRPSQGRRVQGVQRGVLVWTDRASAVSVINDNARDLFSSKS